MTQMSQRQAALGLLARATLPELEAAEARFASGLNARDLRPAETGLIMLRGRIGGDGAPFNIGEATLSRASVALDDGTIGHGHTLGRDMRKARLIAVMDALLQTDKAGAIRENLLEPLAERIEAARQKDKAETAATRVDFFTLVRGED